MAYLFLRILRKEFIAHFFCICFVISFLFQTPTFLPQVYAYPAGSCCCDGPGNLPTCNGCGVPLTSGGGTICPNGYSFVNDSATCPIHYAKFTPPDYVCIPPAPVGTTYSCGNNTLIPSFCHNGPSCGNGYGYTDLYTCNPNMWDGCCMQCAPAQTCANPPESTISFIPDGNCGWTTCYPYCNTGGPATNPACSACSASQPTNTCGSTSGNQTCYHNTNYYGDPCDITSQSAYSTGCGYNYNSCSNNYYCPTGAGYQQNCQTTIKAHAFIDYDHDGVQNNGEPNFPGVQMNDNGYIQTTDGNGNATDANSALVSGVTAYVQMTAPAQSGVVWQNSVIVKSITLTNNNGGSTLTYAFVPIYSISGTVYSDTNKNQRRDGGEPGLSGMTVRITGNGVNTTTNTDGNGNYSFGNLLSGTYTVSVASSLPAGYQYTTPYSWAVTVGNRNGSPSCSTSTSPDASCGNPNNGSISGLNFGATNENPHYGSVCMDIRTDNSGGATISDPFPAPGATCGGANGSQAIINNGTCSTGSGIIFSCNGTFDFSLGSPDANNWTAGGANQNAECYTGGGLDVIPTSYDFLMTTAKESNITPTNLDNTQNSDPNTSCTTTDCTLPATLPKGIYQVNGDLTLHNTPYTFPAPADPTKISQAYIILIKGNLFIKSNILVPKGSVVVFSVSGNMYVDPSVGNVITDPTSTTVNTPNLEGVYSADQSFIVQSNTSGNNLCNADGTPLDKRLYVLGVVVTNAAKGGGSFVNNRDLCIYDTSCSSVEIGDGTNVTDQGVLLNYLLNLIADGKFLSTKNFNWQELKP